MHCRILCAFRRECSNISSSDNCCVCSAGCSPVGNSDQVLGEDAKARKKIEIKIMIIRHPRMLCVYMEQLNKCSKKKSHVSLYR